MQAGAISEFILQPFGGAWRTVKITGGCTSCGARNGVFAYDKDGHLTREQNASGYITVRGYTAGRLTSVQQHLKPAGCDPETSTTRCMLEPASLASAATFDSTPATLTTRYEYADPLWPDKPTDVITPSLTQGDRQEHVVYHPLTGEVVLRSTKGWTTAVRPRRDDTVSVSMRTDRSTTIDLYGEMPHGDAPDLDQTPNPYAPAFDPGGTFSADWLLLAQPTLLRKSVDGPRGDAADVTSFVYYPVHASVPSNLRGRLAATRNALGHITRFESYDAFGNVTRAVDPNGVATEMTYDALGRLLTTTIKAMAGCDATLDALCASDLTTTRIYFPAAGPLQSETRPSGGVVKYTYDDRGRIETVSRGPSLTDLREKMVTGYDPLTGRKSLEQFFVYETGAWIEKKREAFSYNTLGELQRTTHPDGTFVEFGYDAEGRLASVRDENHAAPNTTYTYDPAGRLATAKQTLTGSPYAPGGFITTQYLYDLHGNLTSVTDPNGNTTSYAFDDLGNLLTQQSPVTHETRYEYDLAGNLTAVTDANLAKTTRTYDVLGRVTSAVSTRAGAASESVSWTYDVVSANAFGVGRLSTMTDPTGSTTYKYERRGLLRREQRQFNDTTTPYTTSFAYDRDGNRSGISYPSGQLGVTYGFDYAGRPTSASGVITSATYLPFGPLHELHFANGTTQTLEYDDRYRMSSNELSIDGLTPPGGWMARYVYGHDEAGNVTNLQDATDSTYHRVFRYDDLNRLTGADTGSSLWGSGSYTWDAMGNIRTLSLAEVIPGTGTERLAAGNPKKHKPSDKPRKKKDVLQSGTQPLGRRMSFDYAGTTPVITAVTLNDLSRPVGHDAAGSELSYVVERTYSPRNLLARVEDAAEPGEPQVHALRYGYDGRGVWVVRAESPSNGPNTTAKRFFVYSPELQLLTVTRDDGPNVWGGGPPSQFANNVDYEIVWFAGRPVAQIAPGGTRLYTFTDHLGTPLLQTDPTRSVAWRVEHEPFGNVYEVRAGTRTDQPLRFPGQELAMTWEGPEESYNIFRWYRAGWGRYTQSDPIGIGGGVNVYSYAEGRPTVLGDRLGLVTWQCRVGVVLKAGEILGGGAVSASCTSQPCQNGKHRLVQLAGGAGGVSVGSPFESSFTDVTMEDDAPTPLASNLSPYFSFKSLGLSIIWGGSLETEVTLGHAHGKTSGFGWGGLSAGFDALWGATTIILDMETCCK